MLFLENSLGGRNIAQAVFNTQTSSHMDKTKFDNLRQDLLETMGDWLDSDTVSFEEIFLGVHGDQNQDDKLHIKMADAAMKVYMDARIGQMEAIKGAEKNKSSIAMTPKEFILKNSDKFQEAVNNGLDIRMDENEIFEWMEKYRAAKFYYYLKFGEIIREGDECEMSANYNDPAKWVPADNTVGQAAPDPRFPAHRIYRRLITTQYKTITTHTPHPPRGTRVWGILSLTINFNYMKFDIQKIRATVLATTSRLEWESSSKGADNSIATIMQYRGEPVAGTYFLCDCIGNTIDLCLATKRKYKNKEGRLVNCKVIETIIPDCHAKFGTALNGCWVIPAICKLEKSTPHAEIKTRLLAALENAKFGASTRHLCNVLFKTDLGPYTVIPGDGRMKQVYGYLKTLQKQGKVSSAYQGHWKLIQKA